jgi:3'-phosphoadenosine 5'-phosphosulfate sulfotransferase (PAPS reductase)/FAD synthetase
MKIQTEVQKLIKENALFVCSHSAGKDSQAMYLFLKSIIPAQNLVVIHADLGEVEWAGVQEHIQETIEHEFHVVRAGKTFFDMVRHRKMFPSAKYRQCTSDLKTQPIMKLIRAIAKKRGYTAVVNCTGIRAEESTARSKKSPFKVNKTLTTQKRAGFDWYPIFTWSTQDVFGFIRKHGQQPHWAYLKGMSRLSCCFCIMANKSDLQLSAQLNPELFQKIVDLEKEVGHTMFMKKNQPIGLDAYIQ